MQYMLFKKLGLKKFDENKFEMSIYSKQFIETSENSDSFNNSQV